MPILNVLMIVFLTFSLPLHAKENLLVEKLQTITSNPKLKQQASQAGKDRASLCKYCHGEDGNSVKSTIPNLASQNAVYLLKQFDLFKKKKRINRTMNEMVKTLTPEDMVNIAVYYSEQEVKPQQQYKPDLMDEGKKLFETRCFSCHGKDAHGKAELPRIASQPSDYIIRTLSSYRSALTKRAETEMSSIGKSLNDRDIEAVTAYLTSLK